MNHFYEEIDEHIQWLINFMNEEYPNNYELVIDNNSGTIRSTLQAQMFLRNDLRSPEGFRKATEKPMNKFIEKLAEVAREHYDNTLCECWKLRKSISISFVKEKRKNGGSANVPIVASSPTSQYRRDESYILWEEMLSLGEYTDKDIVKSLARAIELLTEENKELRQEIKNLRTAPAMWINSNLSGLPPVTDKEGE